MSKFATSIMNFIECLRDLAEISHAQGSDNAGLDPSAKLKTVFALIEHTKGWETDLQYLKEDGLYLIQLATDKITGAKIVVVYSKGDKGYFPVHFRPVSEAEQHIDLAETTLKKLSSIDEGIREAA